MSAHEVGSYPINLTVIVHATCENDPVELVGMEEVMHLMAHLADVINEAEGFSTRFGNVMVSWDKAPATEEGGKDV